MNDAQFASLWAFSRGDLPGPAFEKWLFEQVDLEDQLGAELRWRLLSANYADRDELWALRKSLAALLDAMKQCECPAIRNLAVIPMGERSGISAAHLLRAPAHGAGHCQR